MKTVDGVSPSVTATDIWISLVVFVLIYLVLGAADVYLMIRYGRKQLGGDSDERPEGGGAAGPPDDGSVEGHGSGSGRTERVPALIY